MDQKDIEYFRVLLTQMLEEATQKGDLTLEDMTDNNEVFADPADRATMESDRAFTLRIRDRERRLIKKIQAALGRIEDGSFGICDECGEEIGVPRLKARPVTKLCINCKSKQEDDERVRGD
ncbi:MAG: RNA polymerase-binding protein DksA [Desulfovibrio sp.]|jgi:DnaK suppressor protein|uniref:RNA polymerase-binding transcription factor DksA n=1 Tax=Nitratidesulfovibrio vulgaris (strain DSM 19637 / Miyazaki F) TaxID=883 RepID=B8DN26_NITV9|nr:RNA polymerase-binding protein DksA [Nitratidesulfovibrio sp. SRB-5]MBZ2171391.1 RNA polymerase-binding protein DksA [Nitratidesulfovibrio sp. SRB-5]MDR3045518.1 RNA polymerase-binding protein DksA [Desulfovibrio sp.]RXF77611.1 RNA polymerase-binding protein DksA [Desulfovibrio sp. DS-1]